MDIQPIFNQTGEFISGITTKIVKFLANLGLNITPIISKLITLVIFLALGLIIIKITEKPIKWAIVVVLFVLAAAVTFSIFT